MEVQAITKNVRMSAQKMREVVRQIQGLPAAQARPSWPWCRAKGARVVAKTLKSAMANAEDLKTHKPEYQGFKTDQLARQARRGRHRHHASSGSLPRRAVRPARFSNATATSKLFCQTNNLMGQKTNPIGLRVAVNKDWALQVVCREEGIRQAAGRRPQDPRDSQDQARRRLRLQNPASNGPPPAAASPFSPRGPAWSSAAKARRLTSSRRKSAR